MQKIFRPLENIKKSVSIIKTTLNDGNNPHPEQGKKKIDQFCQFNRGSLIEFNDFKAPVFFLHISHYN